MPDGSVLLDKQRVKGFDFSNRYVCAPFDIMKASSKGLVTEELLHIYENRKGPSCIIVEQAAIAPEGQYRENLLFIDRDECIEGMSKLASIIHQNDQVAVVQINHAGSSANSEITGLEALAPSSIVNPATRRSLPRALSLKDIHEIRDQFVSAARRVKRAGFDGVEIHNCHGFLLSQFLSPITNIRTDQYGGNLENRSRLLLEITRAVREAVGDDFLLLVRLGLDDLLPGGMTIDEGCFVAKKLEEAGIDILDVSTGLMPPFGLQGPALLRDMFRTVKQHVSIPVIGAGELDDIEIAADLVEKGEIDFIGLARSIMKQPNYVEDLIDKINANK